MCMTPTRGLGQLMCSVSIAWVPFTLFLAEIGGLISAMLMLTSNVLLLNKPCVGEGF